MDRFGQLFVDWYNGGMRNIDDFANSAWEVISLQGQRLLKKGKTINSAEENIEEFKVMARKFIDKSVPILKTLKII